MQAWEQETATHEEQVAVLASAVRAALDLASAPAEERVAVSEALPEEYDMTIQASFDPLIPYWLAPKVVPVAPDMAEQLRTWQATARSG